jgi:hypothetical protein
MNDFHTTAVPMSSNITPKTFSPSQMAPLLAQHAASRREDTVGEESESLKHLVAQPYGERAHKPVKAEAPKAKKVEVKVHEKIEPEHETHHGGITLKTGGALIVEGARGLRRQVAKMVHHGKSTYAGLSHGDQHLFVDKIVKHARALTTGSKIGFTTRRNIKESIRGDYLKGKITSTDVKKMNELTDTLH